MSSTAVFSYTHSVTYVADNILKSLKDILVLSGLDPQKLASDRTVLHAGIKQWIESKHLERVTLEVFHPSTDALLFRWDIEMSYTWSTEAGAFWTDTDQLRYAIRKQGVAPSEAKYRILASSKAGKPAVAGWSDTELRSTSGMLRQSVGATVEHNGLGANAAYWRKV
jgi:hypothetical protein